MRKTIKKIGFDLDDTIIDHEPNRQKLLAESSAEKMHESLPTEEKIITLKEKLYGRLSLDAPPMPRAIETLRLIAEAGAELYIVSKRRQSSQKFARLWIGENLPFIDARMIHFVETHEDKSAVCNEIGIEIFMDDHPQVLRSLPASTIPILFDKHDKNTAVMFKRTTSWVGFLDIYKKLAV